MSREEPPCLRIPKKTVAAEIAGFRSQASELLGQAPAVIDGASADTWRFAFESWRAAAREFLQNAYTTAGPADEFFAKARRPGVARVGRVAWRERHSHLVENLKEAENVLAALLDRLDRVPMAEGLEFIDSAAMTQRLTRSREDVESMISGAVEQGQQLLRDAEVVTDAVSYQAWVQATERWHALTREGLVASYAEIGPATEFYDSATGGIVRIWGGQSEEETFQYRREATQAGVNTLVSLRERLVYAADAVEPEVAPPELGEQSYSRTVFVVHGRDEGLREQVAAVLTRLGFETIILAQQPNQGQTVIEKFEGKALDVGFAVVILSPDDFGKGPDETDFPSEPNRARQNVVLELGYFMGKLGRSRVAPLFRRGTELPSDIHGLAYIEIDVGGAWKFKLASELAAAGYDVDFNRLKDV